MNGDTNVDLHRQTETITAIDAALKKYADPGQERARLEAVHQAISNHRFYTLSHLEGPRKDQDPDFYAPLFDTEVIGDSIYHVIDAAASIIAPRPEQPAFGEEDVEFALRTLTLFVNSLPKFSRGLLGSNCPGIDWATRCADEYIANNPDKLPSTEASTAKTLIHSLCHGLTKVAGGVVTGNKFIALPSGDIKFRPTRYNEIAVLGGSFDNGNYTWTAIPFDQNARKKMQQMLDTDYAPADPGPSC